MITESQRALGCMFGGAFGDSLGAAAESMSAAEVEEAYWLGRQTVGVITNETDQALAVGCGLMSAALKGQSLAGFKEPVQRHLSNWHAAKTYPVQRQTPGGSPNYTRPDNNLSNACDAVTRVYPVGLYVRDPYSAYQAGADIAALTHGGQEAQVAAGALATMISCIMAGNSVLMAATRCMGFLAGDPRSHRVTVDLMVKALRLAAEKEEKNPSVLGDGLDGSSALATAVYCAVRYEKDFAQGMRLAVSTTGDPISSGTICGALLGTKLGLNAIPRHWPDQVERSRELHEVAIRLSTIMNTESAAQSR